MELRLGTLTPGQEESVATRHHGRRLRRGSFPTMHLTQDQHYIWNPHPWPHTRVLEGATVEASTARVRAWITAHRMKGHASHSNCTHVCIPLELMAAIMRCQIPGTLANCRCSEMGCWGELLPCEPSFPWLFFQLVSCNTSAFLVVGFIYFRGWGVGWERVLISVSLPLA